MNHMHNPNLSRYVVQSSNVISDLRVNILEENSTRVIWYKERFLSDEEIVEHIVHNQTSTICWTVHRPKQGWYIRVRSPTFPPGVFIPLLPIPRSSQNFADAALSFLCRTSAYPASSAPDVHKGSTDSLASDRMVVHSYPPTPPSVPIVTAPPSLSEIETKLDTIGSAPAKATTERASRVVSTKITQFLLTPHSSPHVPGPLPGEQLSLVARAFSFFQNHKPSHSVSFTLCALDRPRDMIQIAGPSSQPRQQLPQVNPKIPSPLLTFHDKTPMLTVGSVTGVLEIDRAEERILAIDTSFWIAIALTYLEFLEDRESYLAALTD